jgi:hypothetical protein
VKSTNVDAMRRAGDRVIRGLWVEGEHPYHGKFALQRVGSPVDDVNQSPFFDVRHHAGSATAIVRSMLMRR